MIANSPQKLQRGKEGFFPGAFRENMDLPTPDFRHLACRTVKEEISVL